MYPFGHIVSLTNSTHSRGPTEARAQSERATAAPRRILAPPCLFFFSMYY